ncbi:MAG: flagellar assembly protein FliH [Rhodocyclaceae bacterium]|nr:flagellar assembly protein FliH [Rhodocyclaceae bacterium]MCB1907762.1 flagellar assembly protein FliH [Rhodocyclaceae bacterium]
MSAITRHQASGAYRPWQPPDFGDADGADAIADAPLPLTAERETEAAMADEIGREAETDDPPQTTAEDPPQFKLPTAEEIEEIYESARKSGFDAGYEEGTARGRVEAMQLHGLAESMDQAMQTLDTEIAQELLDVAIEIARHLIRRELRNFPETVLDTVREALQQFPQNNALVHLHPEDAGLIREYLGEQVAHLGHRIIEDDAIGRGGCRLEASGSELDATLETRWKRILSNLGRDDAAGITP